MADWFNYYGLIFVVVLMIPNVIYAIRNKNTTPSYRNKAAEAIEIVARFFCIALMIFNIPFTWIGFYFQFAEIVYLAVNSFLLAAYVIFWIVFRKKNGVVKALLLSVLPTLVFLFSGVMIGSIPLVVSSVFFGATHVLISVKNTERKEKKFVRKSVLTVITILVSFVFLFIAVFGGAVIEANGRLKKLPSMTWEEMVEYDVEGGAKISVAMIENGKTSYYVRSEDVWGSYVSDDPRTRISDLPLFDYEIGSVSKTFVGLLCAKAMQEGKLRSDGSISDYLPLDKNKYYPTIERLLTHTSGYPAYYFEPQMIANKLSHEENDFYGIGKDKILSKVAKTELADRSYPFVYSNFGIAVVGMVLESVYDMPFYDLMNGFLQELSLNNTEVNKQGGTLSGYWNWKNDDGYLPAGAIHSDLFDMTKYLRLYLQDDLPYLSDSYAEKQSIGATDPTYKDCNIRLDAIGFTWILDKQNGLVWHNGATTRFNSYIGFTQDRKKGVVILSDLGPNERIPSTVIGARILTD